DAFRAPGIDTEVIYASKAFICQAMCKIAVEEGLSIDVSSGGELYVALSAGVPPDKIYMHGNNKTSGELEFAIRENVGRLVVDSFNELELLVRLAAERDARVPVLLRITPGIKPSTHGYVQTGQIDSKFGFGLSDGSAMEAIRAVLGAKTVELKGIHAHIGSQIFALRSYAKAIELIVEFMKAVRDETGFEIGELNAGGGLGISYEATDEPSTVEEYADVILTGVATDTKKLGLAMPKVMIEPGRSIVGNAGVTLYRVGTIKKIPRVRTYISVDGGMSDNIRPMLYEAVYEAVSKARQGDGPSLLEAKTYRWKGHSKSDQERYRTREEVNAWKEKCPIKRFGARLIAESILTPGDIESIETEVHEEIEAAVEFAEASPEPRVEDILEGVYA
ncbi:MAG: diaminopimelate decarboxylase, partial [bacterium]